MPTDCHARHALYIGADKDYQARKIVRDGFRRAQAGSVRRTPLHGPHTPKVDHVRFRRRRPDARRRVAGTRLHDAHPGAGSHAFARDEGRRRAGLGPHGLRQDSRLRAGAGADAAWRRRALRRSRRAARPRDRADARARHAGQARTRVALCRGGRADRLLRRRHGHALGAPHAGTWRPYRGRHAGPPARPHHAPRAGP